MDMYTSAVSLLPERIRKAAMGFDCATVEEIRLRLGKAPTLLINGIESEINFDPVSENELNGVLERATGASLHAHLEELREGFINYHGLRIGFCATGIYKNGQIQGFKNFTSLNIRISSAFKGNISTLIRDIRADGYRSTLLISPPGGGKTTLLRELVRLLSNDGVRISVIDERNELAAAEQGRPYFDLGAHSDVMIGVKKREAAMMQLRAMNPQIIALDEISRAEDMETVFEINGCGVEILATAHGKSLEDLRQRELYRRLLDEKIFGSVILINNTARGREFIYKRLSN